MGGALKFAVVREDPDVESEVLAATGARSIVLVASGGCTALTLACRDPGLAIAAFDVNAAQLDHVRAKARAAAAGELARLNVGHEDATALNERGEFEKLFRVLRTYVREFVAPREELERFFDPRSSPDERAALRAGWLASPYWPAAFDTALNEPLLHAMFTSAATQHAPRGSYPGYFRRAFERGLARDDAATNPFLQHLLLGRYREADAPDYVLARREPGLELVLGALADVPRLARFEVASLSNVFDWSDDALVTSWAALLLASRPRAIVVRQLNNQRDVARFFAPAYALDEALSARLLARDRSLFYERVLVLRRREA